MGDGTVRSIETATLAGSILPAIPEKSSATNDDSDVNLPNAPHECSSNTAEVHPFDANVGGTALNVASHDVAAATVWQASNVGTNFAYVPGISSCGNLSERLALRICAWPPTQSAVFKRLLQNVVG